VFAFVLSAGLIACFVWFEAWSRADVARTAAALKRAGPADRKWRQPENQYCSIASSPLLPDEPRGRALSHPATTATGVPT